MKNLKIFGIILVTSFALALISCDNVQEDQPSTGLGKVVVNITDAPFPADLIDEVMVTIDRVELRIAGGTCTTTTGETVGDKNDHGKGKKKVHDYSTIDCDGGFILVSGSTATSTTIDLLQLQNGLMAVLADAEIPVGKYDMIRLHVVEATVKIDENTSFLLKVPSGDSSGLKIFLDNELTVTENETGEILVDFDLSHSFVALGNLKSKKGITGFIFKPVIRAINNTNTGSIYGKVYEGESTPVTGAQVTVLQAGNEVTTALSNDKGYYKVMGLQGGTYSMTIEKDGYTKVEVNNIVVTPKTGIKKDVQLVKQ